MPPPLETVEVPHYLSPSNISELEQCPLRVLARQVPQGSSLPSSPEAFLGRVLHHVREQLTKGRWGDFDKLNDAFDGILRVTIEETDEFLRSEPRTRQMAPLRQAVGRAKWRGRIDDLRTTVNRLPPPPRPLEFSAIQWGGRPDGSAVDEVQLDRLEAGPEAWIVCNRFRLRGRPDDIAERDDGTIVITDYKSAASTLLDDDARGAYQRQLQLYGLMAEEVSGKVSELYLDGAVRLPVEWNDTVRAVVSAEVEDLMNKYPEGTEFQATELARPGAVCRGCVLRPACSGYLQTAPSWWSATEDSPRPLPMDIWGQVLEYTEVDGRWDIDLLDGAERNVRVSGVDLAGRDIKLDQGSTVFFFDLEPSEPLIQHGVHLHPRSLHEHPGKGRSDLRKAIRAQVLTPGRPGPPPECHGSPPG